MKDETKTVAYLEELLEHKDDEIDDLEKQIAVLEYRLRLHESGDLYIRELPKEQLLPVPRLELEYVESDYGWSNYTVYYNLVYRHLLGDIQAVMLSRTNVSSGRRTAPVSNDGKIDLPFIDGAHVRADAIHLGFPAFATCNGTTEKLTG